MAMVITSNTMARMISRNEAAGLLDCNPQTVTNWVEKGIIKGHMVDNRLLIDRESITQYFDSLKDLADMEKKLADVTNEMQAKIDDMREILDVATSGVLPIYHVKESFRNANLMLVSLFEDRIPDRERVILTKLLEKKSPEDIGKALGLTSERVIVNGTKAALKLADISFLKKIKDENSELLKENERLTNKVAELNARLDEKGNESLTKILKKRLINLDLSVRTRNALLSLGCDTIGDVVKLDKSEIKNTRNVGKKSFMEIDEYIKKLGLHWGMNSKE